MSKGPLCGTRVLVVEDDYFLATDACEWLKEAGAEIVGPTPDAAEACRLILRGEVDRAIVDINLGEGPSFVVASKLSESAVPFLFATGYDKGVIPEPFQDTPRLEKPFKGEQLIALVRSLG